MAQLQLLALALESAGVMLVVLEVFLPNHADRFESFIDNHRSWSEPLAWGALTVIAVIDATLFLFILSTAEYSPEAAGTSFLAPSGAVPGPNTPPLWSIWPIVVLSLFAPFVHLVVMESIAVAMRFLNRVGNGYATAGLGVCFAVLGLIIEIIQVMSIGLAGYAVLFFLILLVYCMWVLRVMKSEGSSSKE